MSAVKLIGPKIISMMMAQHSKTSHSARKLKSQYQRRNEGFFLDSGPNWRTLPSNSNSKLQAYIMVSSLDGSVHKATKALNWPLFHNLYRVYRRLWWLPTDPQLLKT